MRVGVLTGGGDAPGLNAAIRAVVLRSCALGHTVLGIHDGWAGLLTTDVPRELRPADVAGIVALGGTILGTSRTDPRKQERTRVTVRERVRELALDAIVAIGGNDTLGVAAWLHDEGIVRVVGVPKTVDNDIAGTDYCIGFDTAVTVVADALDRLRTTASAHHRVIVVEVMGRDTGWVAAVGGLAGEADVIIVPEIPVSIDEITRAVRARRTAGDEDIIVVVAEAADIRGIVTEEVVDRDAFGHPRLDQRAVGALLARHIEHDTGIEARVVVLGHLQRGGSPTVQDRFWATRLGHEAADLVDQGRSGILPVARGGKVEVATLADAVATTRGLPDDLLAIIRHFAGVAPSSADQLTLDPGTMPRS